MTASTTAPHEGAVAAAPDTRQRLLPGWRPLAFVAAVAVLTAAALLPITRNTYLELLGETLFISVAALMAFRAGALWRQAWLPGWVVQLVAVIGAILLAPLVVQLLMAGGSFSRFTGSAPHVRGYVLITFGGGILGAVLALGAIVRERDAQVRSELLQLQLASETLERQAADARLRLLTAQVQPHFLLNTLANVQALVESGSPQAVPVFRSLIAYLRAAMPRLQEVDATLGNEESLVRAYLELMQMRMPDRLTYRIDVDPGLRSTRFPPMTLLTLVENAIRHGIDPGIAGGSVEVGAREAPDGRVLLWVSDTGVGMRETAAPGTGLTNLRERLQASFGTAARLELTEVTPHGLRAEVWLPRAA